MPNEPITLGLTFIVVCVVGYFVTRWADKAVAREHHRYIEIRSKRQQCEVSHGHVDNARTDRDIKRPPTGH